MQRFKSPHPHATIVNLQNEIKILKQEILESKQKDFNQELKYIKRKGENILRN